MIHRARRLIAGTLAGSLVLVSPGPGSYNALAEVGIGMPAEGVPIPAGPAGALSSGDPAMAGAPNTPNTSGASLDSSLGGALEAPPSVQDPTSSNPEGSPTSGHLLQAGNMTRELSSGGAGRTLQATESSLGGLREDLKAPLGAAQREQAGLEDRSRASESVLARLQGGGLKVPSLPAADIPELPQALRGSPPGLQEKWINDEGRLNPTRVRGVARPRSEEEIVALVHHARSRGWKVSVAGGRYSTGGQTFYRDNLVLDLSEFDAVTVRPEERVVVAQAGATWAKVQEKLNLYGLSVDVMQRSNIFTVGGSLGVNAHGDNADSPPIASTVRSLRVLLADGTVVQASRAENAELFSLVLGGYGLLGVILEAELAVRDDEVYQPELAKVDSGDFPGYFAEHMAGQGRYRYAHGFLSLSPKSLLGEVGVAGFVKTPGTSRPGPARLGRGKWAWDLLDRIGPVFSWKVATQPFWQRLAWRFITSAPALFGRRVRRNEVMDVRPIAIVNRSGSRVPVYQEYFVPRDRFAAFLDRARDVLRRHKAPVVLVEVRGVQRDDTPFLAYAPRQDHFGLSFPMIQPASPEGRAWIDQVVRELTEAALSVGGTFYLPFRLAYTLDQLRRAYPNIDRFFELKRKYDPEELFVNHWYAKYGQSPKGLDVAPQAAESGSPSVSRLKAHVAALAGRIGPRSALHTHALQAARDYIVARLRSYGYEPELQAYPARSLPGVPDGTEFHNISVRAGPPAGPDEPVWIVGAHYDSDPRSPGADDNASGVAVLLELARRFRERPPDRPVFLVAYPNEEAPAFGTPNMGSYQHVQELLRRGVRVSGMIGLEMLGYYDPRPGAQSHPWPLHWFLPRRGDFLGLVGNLRSRGLVRSLKSAWRANSGIPLVAAALPELFRDARRSDHAHYWDAGFPAVMLTDTANFRNPHYHGPKDTPETLDYERLAAVAEGLEAALRSPAHAGPGATPGPAVVEDAGHLERTSVRAVLRPRTEGEVRLAVLAARAGGLKVALAGARHSMGGQTAYPDAVVLDLRELAGMSLDKERRLLRVQAGATWDQIQRFLDPEGLSVDVMQTHKIFTVGGTLSVNAHGSNPDSGPVASTVRSLRVLTSGGDILRASRQENADLFRLVLGGYGAAVILEAELGLRENETYRTEHRRMDYTELPSYFRDQLSSGRYGYAHSFLSISPDSFLREASILAYARAPEAGPPPALRASPLNPRILRAWGRLLNRAKASPAWQRMAWFVLSRVAPRMPPRVLSRNQAMDIGILPIADPAKGETLILQEYFIPHRHFAPFVDRLRELVRGHGASLVVASVRQVKQDETALLSYSSRENRLAIVLNFVQALTPEADRRMAELTRGLIDEALRLEGTFYLPYRPAHTAAQLEAAYPNLHAFFRVKRRYDPSDTFMNGFFARYEGRSSPEAGP